MSQRCQGTYVNSSGWKRCRLLARASPDGIYRCGSHRGVTAFDVQFYEEREAVAHELRIDIESASVADHLVIDTVRIMRNYLAALERSA